MIALERLIQLDYNKKISTRNFRKERIYQPIKPLVTTSKIENEKVFNL